MKNLTTIIFALLLSMAASACGWKQQLKMADKEMAKKYFANAADRYEHLLRDSTKMKLPHDSIAAIHAHLAYAYQKMEYNSKAETHYAEVVKSGKADAAIIFDYARCLQAMGKYSRAKVFFNMVAENKSIKYRNPKAFADLCDAIGDEAMAAYENSGVRSSFNTNAAEFAPAVFKGGLVITSNRSERSRRANRIEWNRSYYTDLFEVATANNGSAGMYYKMPYPLNSKYNDAAACFNAAGDEIFFTRNNRKCKKHDYLQILHSKFNGTSWSKPEVLNFETNDYSYAHPALSADGNTLYFSSNMQGSFGGMDIFMSRRNGSIWETPVNVGVSVNSFGNETFPSVGPDSTLYFTSDGLPGYGGMDLFSAKAENGKFITPAVNLGPGINSRFDDLSAVVLGNKLYLASNRQGDDDIYRFETKPKFSGTGNNPAENRPMLKQGLVTDAKSKAPISDARLEFMQQSNAMNGTFVYSDGNGRFQYAPNSGIARASKDGYKAVTFAAADMLNADTFSVQLEPEVKEPVLLGSAVLYFDVNKASLSRESLDKLQALLAAIKSNASNIVNVSGYADERGNETYNYGLALRRVKSAVDYLLSQEVTQTNIHSAFFGAVKLDDTCRKSAKCMNETNRQNRRVEVKVFK
ncbi:MAG: OmpA family protein [Chitinophagales bacterium]